MMKSNSRLVTGILSGVVSLAAVAQEPAADPRVQPVEEAKVVEAVEADPFKAPDDVAAAPEDAEKTESGLASKVLQKGTGTESPSARDTVKVHYTGWQSSDGSMFDSSKKRGQAASFPLNQVIPGWTEGLQLMVVGESRRFWIPGKLAYGDTPQRPGAPSGDLVFDVELLEIVKAPEPPKTPENLTAPADAQKTDSGLATKVLVKGEGDAKPGASDIVKVNFSGWQADGEFLVSSAMRQAGPAELKLDEVPIKGWTEGIQLMVKGEKRRMWIPADLAFGAEPPQGAPGGDLIFDFELVDFEEYVDPYPAPEDVAAAPADAEKTESGLATKVLTPGVGGEKPALHDTVTIQFTGWKSTGEFVGGSEAQGRPLVTKLKDAPLQGWVEGIQLMTAGEVRRMWVPAALGFKGSPEQDDLVFDIKVISIEKPLPAPGDVAGPPEDAEKTASGLASKVLEAGTGDKKPTADSKVTVHYTGWTTDGEMFDSSALRGEPSTFGLGQVIPGWTEGLQLMVEGEKRRFWIPGNLAYDGQPTRPQGMLVFEVELIKIN
ncbi:MAG: FKBP-type peptidyl-prolyl cis-trans isomerase [Verrucomicrobiaceae bacterium]